MFPISLYIAYTKAFKERLNNLKKGIGVLFTKVIPFNFNKPKHVLKYIELLSISITRLEGLVSALFNNIGEIKVTK